MCGIFAYYHYNSSLLINNIIKININGLKRLEYRGYDSAGICISNILNKSIIIKSIGNVSNLYNKIKNCNITDELINSSSSISHTRWATHGKPSDINAHPHTSDETNQFVVVHNGIISNFDILKNFLKKNGYLLKSKTDTEVIPKLCKYYYDLNKSHNFVDIVTEVVKKLEGTFAIIIKSSLFNNELIACKKGSPLLIGLINDNNFILSSDISAIIDHTNKIITMDNYELLHINNNNFYIKNYNNNSKINKDIILVNIDELDIFKGEFNTYMEKEIFEQPISIKKTMKNRISNNNINIIEINSYINKITQANKIILLACGTSYHSCLASKIILEDLIGISVYVECASDFVDREALVTKDDIFIFISQSGETADTLFALQYVKNKKAFTIAITNKENSAIALEANISFTLNIGFEISVASTKAYTSQLIMFVMLALKLSNKNINICNELINLPNIIYNTILITKNKIQQIIDNIIDYNSILFIGRGNNYATALESALKMKEIAYIHSEGILASELKHGPLALIDDNIISFVFATKDKMYEKNISVLEQLKARNAKLIVICNENDFIIKNMFESSFIIEVPLVHEYLQHIVNIIPMQLLAYNVALTKGYCIDQPRNLAKSVTVSD